MTIITRLSNLQNLFRYLSACVLLVLAVPFARAQEIKVGVGNFEPYFEDNGNSGLFTDLIRATFALLPQYSLKIIDTPMSNYRLLFQLNDGEIDGAANIFMADNVKGCISQAFFRYDEVAVTLKQRHLKIDGIADLKDKSIITYQNAKLFFPKEFSQVVDANPTLYHETPTPSDQLRILTSGGADVSIGDRYIFLYNLKNWNASKLKAADFDFHPILGAQYTAMAFANPKLCEDFNHAAQKIIKNGSYEAIYKRYLTELQ